MSNRIRKLHFRNRSEAGSWPQRAEFERYIFPVPFSALLLGFSSPLGCSCFSFLPAAAPWQNDSLYASAVSSDPCNVSYSQSLGRRMVSGETFTLRKC